MSAPAPPSSGGSWPPAPQQTPSGAAPPGGSPAGLTGRPLGAMVLAILGGLFIILGGIVERAVGSLVSSFGFGLGGAILSIFGDFGILLGILIIVFGVLAFVRPQQHGLFGVLIIVFSLLSLVSYLGGFIIGFILALIAGILALIWKPRAA